MADETELPEAPVKEDKKANVETLSDLCEEYLNNKRDKVSAAGVELGHGSFIRRNGASEFATELQNFIDKLLALNVLGKTPANEPDTKYFFTRNLDAHLALFKYID